MLQKLIAKLLEGLARLLGRKAYQANPKLARKVHEGIEDENPALRETKTVVVPHLPDPPNAKRAVRGRMR